MSGPTLSQITSCQMVDGHDHRRHGLCGNRSRHSEKNAPPYVLERPAISPTGGLEVILVITVRGICWPGIQSAQPAKANGASGIALLVPDHKPLAGTAAVGTGTAVRRWY